MRCFFTSWQVSGFLLLASPALVQVTGGSVYVPVVNIGTSDVLLFPLRVLGSLVRVHVVSLPAGVTEVRPITTNVYSQATLAAISTDFREDCSGPSSVTELQSFLGFSSYYRRFV